MRFLTINKLLSLLALICLYLLGCYLVAIRVNNALLKGAKVEDAGMLASFSKVSLKNTDGKAFSAYEIIGDNSKTTLLYLPDAKGALPHVLNSAAARYNVLALNYFEGGEKETAETLASKALVGLKYLNSIGVPSSKIIVFGYGLGANIALKAFSSEDTSLKAMLLLNQIDSERQYCNRSFGFFLCLLVPRNLEAREPFTPVPIYSFYNQNGNLTLDDAHEVFNKIDAAEKFFFEIPGEDLNFNANHIFDFYANESTGLGTYENINIDESLNGLEDLIDGDGLLGPAEEYID